MPRLAICSCDLHWHWINRTLLYHTMEVSMLRLAWLTIAQHVFQPALTGRLESISRKIVSCETGNKGYRGEQISRKNCLPWIGSQELPRFREKYHTLGRQKMGSNMRSRYIQFRHISGVHCICFNGKMAECNDIQDGTGKEFLKNKNFPFWSST